MLELAALSSDPEYDELASSAIIALSRNVVSKTYLKGVIDIVNVIADPERYGEKWYQNFVGSFIPNGLNQFNRNPGFEVFDYDNEMKEVNSIKDALYKRLWPSLSRQVPPKRNAVTGEPMLYGSGFLGGMLPFYRAEESDDPVMVELHRLGMNVSDLPDAIKGIDLSPEEYDKYQRVVTQDVKIGTKNLRDFLAELIEAPGYQELTDGTDEFEGGKGYVIQKAIRKYRQMGLKQMIAESPELLLKVVDRIERKRAAKYLENDGGGDVEVK